jgi:hypothetical protein
MRHLIKFLILSIMISLVGLTVFAATLSTTISGGNTVEVGSQVTLTFAFDVDEPIKQMTAKLVYDSDFLQLVGSPVALNGVDVLVNEDGEITASFPEGKSGSVSFMRVTFRAKETFIADDSTNVTLSNVSGILFESDEAISGSGSTRLITAVAAKSTNNYLSNLFTNAGSIEFNRNTFEYTLIVENDVSRIRIVATPEDSKASVKEDATYNLSVYKNVINVVVTAQSGAKRTYTINVIRKDTFGNTSLLSSNSQLKSLSVDGYPFDFSPLIFEYRLMVENIVDNVLVMAQADDAKSSVIIDNVNMLKLGENRIQITVVAENGQSRIYTIFVTRSLEAPVSRLQDLGDIVYQTTASILPLIIDDVYWLSSEVLEKVRRAAKILDIQKLDEQGQLVFRWMIDGRSITAGMGIDTRISLQSVNADKIRDLLDSSRFKTIVFSHQGELPIGTVVRVYLGNMFPSMEKLNLYRYDTETKSLDLNTQSVQSDNGYVEFEVLMAGEYVVTDVDVPQRHPLDLVLFAALAIIVLLIIALTWLLLSRNKKTLN